MNVTVVQPEAFLRKGLAAVVVLDLVSFWFFVSDAGLEAAAHRLVVPTWAAVAGHGLTRTLLVVLGTVAALLFGRRAGRAGAATVALACLAALSMTHAQLYGSPWRHLYFSGAGLLGWLAGMFVARRQGEAEDESYARIGALALLGAVYLNGGISKLAFGGVDWLSGLPIQAIVVAQDGLVPEGWFGGYRIWVANSPRWAQAFSIVTVGLELAGPLLLVEGWARRLVAIGLLAMHLNIFVLTHIPYVESIMLLALLGLGRSRAVTRVGLDPDRAWRFRRFVIATGLAAAIAIVYQAQRYASAIAHRDARPSQNPAQRPADDPRRNGGSTRMEPEFAPQSAIPVDTRAR